MRETMKLDSFIFYSSFYEALRELPLEQQAMVYDAVFKYAFEGGESDLVGVPKAIFALIKPQLKANREKYISGCKGGEFGYLGGAKQGNQNARKDKKNNPTNDENEERKQPLNDPIEPLQTTPEQPSMIAENNPMPRNETTHKQPKTTPNYNYNVNVNENYNVNENENYREGEKKEHLVEKKEKEKSDVVATRSIFKKPSLIEVKDFFVENGLGSEAEEFYDYYESNGWRVGKNPMRDWGASARRWRKQSFSFSGKTAKQEVMWSDIRDVLKENISYGEIE